MKENIETRVMGMFLIMLIILGWVAVRSVQTIQRSSVDYDWVNHTHEIMIQGDGILSSLRAGDAAMASYLLTGNPRDQDAYRVFYNEMKSHLEAAQALTHAVTEQAQHQEFAKLEDLIKNHIDFARVAVHAREQGGVQAAAQSLNEHSDAETLGTMQRLIKALNEGQKSLLRQRDKESSLQAQTTRVTVITGVIINFVLLTFVFCLLRDDLAARRMAAVALEEANVQLEAKVQRRTAELVQSNSSLKKENLERRWSNQALDHQLRYSALIIDSISEMVFVISKALNISRINPAVLHVTKWEAQELVAQSVDRVLRLSPNGPLNPISVALNEGREIQERSAFAISKDGVSIPVRLSVVPVRDENKVVGGVITARADYPPGQRTA
jgi:PAS domain S-box-containing protein